MVNRKGQQEKSTIYKTLHKKKNIKQHGGELRCPEGLPLTTPLMTLIFISSKTLYYLAFQSFDFEHT
jgi:hypothetical protein